MRRFTATSLILLASLAQPHAGWAQGGTSTDGSLAGTREVGIFGSGRLLSTEYSVEDGRSGFGGAATFGTHLTRIIAVQGGLGINYSRQELTYYRPPLWTFTPTISLLLQRPTMAETQPYAIVGAGYEFIRYTHPRCDCEQSRSLGVASLGVGVRRMLSGRRAFRAELSSQIGKGGPAFTGLAGLSLFVGGNPQSAPRLRPPARIRTEPPVTRPRDTRTTTAPPAAVIDTVLAPVPAPSPASVRRVPPPSPLPTGVGTVLLAIDGTQVDFSKVNWIEDAEGLLDGLVVDLVSDAGESIRLSIEAHTDNVGANSANIILGLDRARAVRDYFVAQGVTEDRIRISSLGEDAPIAPNTTAIGRQQNRRIIIKRDN